MASTSQSKRRIDQLATQTIIGALQSDKVFSAEQAIPTIPVGSKNASGILFHDKAEEYMGSPELITGSKGELSTRDPYPEGGDLDPEKTTYACQRWAPELQKVYPLEEDRSHYPVSDRTRKALKMARQIKLRREWTGSTACFTAANWNSNLVAAVGALSGGAQVAWNAAGSKPAKDGHVMKKAVRDRLGMEPNKARISYDVFHALAYHQDVMGIRGDEADGPIEGDPVQVSQRLLLQRLADMWGLQEVTVDRALYNNASYKKAKALSDMSTGKVLFYCDYVGDTGSAANAGASIVGAPASMVRLREYDVRAYNWEENNPEALVMASEFSETIIVPTGMADSAFLLTGAVA